MKSSDRKEKSSKKYDDIDDQQNKDHQGLNKKLKKHRKHEKEVKKEKKMEKKQHNDRKDRQKEQYVSEESNKKDKKRTSKDSKGIKIDKLKKVVHKFMKIYKDDIEDVKGIFSSLDQGEEIEIQDIENPIIRQYLAKIFKYLKLHQKTGKQGYRKNLSKTDFALSNYMNGIINEKMEQSSVTQSSDSENISSSSDSPSSKKQRILSEEQVQKDTKQQTARVLGPSIPIGNVLEPALITQDEKVGASNWMIQGNLDEFLNDSFKEVESSEIKKFLQNKNVQNGGAKRALGPQLDKSRLAAGSAPFNLENVVRDDEEAVRSIEDYEEKYRSKTLMQIHQENLKKKKEEQGKETFRKPFDRNEDLQYKFTDSKKLFAALKDSFQHGPKFQPSSQQ